VSTIRPANLTPASPIARPVDAARLAAQKAFFEAALGKAPTAAASPSPVAAAQAAPVQRVPELDAPKPQKLLRPGSLLDIRV
jgi:hypothetical protein